MAGFIFRPFLAKVNVRRVGAYTSSSASSHLTTSGLVLTGNGSITGKVLENGLPVSRRVMLYERRTGVYAAQTRSNKDGDYTFKRTNEALTYFIVSVDDNNDGVQYNLVGQDLISGNHDKRVAT